LLLLVLVLVVMNVTVGWRKWFRSEEKEEKIRSRRHGNASFTEEKTETHSS